MGRSSCSTALIFFLDAKSNQNMNDLQIRNATKNDVPIILGMLVELERPKPKNDEDITIFEKRIKQLRTR